MDQKVIDSVKQKEDVDSITFFCHFHQTIVLVKTFLCNLIYIRISPTSVVSSLPAIIHINHHSTLRSLDGLLGLL